MDRPVAIKMLQPPGSTPSAPDSPEAAEIVDALDRDRKRFLREIRTTAQLERPGTPTVYESGVETAQDGSTQLWLVMQLLRGSTLRLEQIAVPLLLLRAPGGLTGTGDAVVPDQIRESITALVPRTTVTDVPGTNHHTILVCGPGARAVALAITAFTG